MNRRGFLKGVFSCAALAALPQLTPSPVGKTVIPTTVRWTQMMYGTPILFMPKKAVQFITLSTTITQ